MALPTVVGDDADDDDAIAPGVHTEDIEADTVGRKLGRVRHAPALNDRDSIVSDNKEHVQVRVKRVVDVLLCSVRVDSWTELIRSASRGCLFTLGLWTDLVFGFSAHR